MSQYHCPACWNNEARPAPAWSVGTVYCPKHWEADPTVVAWREGAKALDEWFARVEAERTAKA